MAYFCLHPSVLAYEIFSQAIVSAINPPTTIQNGLVASDIRVNGNISFDTLGTRTITIGRNTGTQASGSNLSLVAGGSSYSSTNQNGGTLTLMSGTSTGTGTSRISLQSYALGSSGTNDNAIVEAAYVLNGNSYFPQNTQFATGNGSSPPAPLSVGNVSSTVYGVPASSAGAVFGYNQAASSSTLGISQFAALSNDATTPFGMAIGAVGDASIANRQVFLQTGTLNQIPNFAYGGSIVLNPSGGDVVIGTATPPTTGPSAVQPTLHVEAAAGISLNGTTYVGSLGRWDAKFSVGTGFAKSDTTPRTTVALAQTNESINSSQLDVLFTGGASQAVRRAALQMGEFGVANSGVLDLMPNGGTVTSGNGLTLSSFATAGLLQVNSSGVVSANSSVTNAGTPASFSANRYLTVVISGATYYLPIATVTW